MIGHQQAAAGITGLKTTLQPPGLEGEAGFEAQENGKEMNDVEMAPKVTNPEAQASTPGDQEPTEGTSKTFSQLNTISMHFVYFNCIRQVRRP